MDENTWTEKPTKVQINVESSKIIFAASADGNSSSKYAMDTWNASNILCIHFELIWINFIQSIFCLCICTLFCGLICLHYVTFNQRKNIHRSISDNQIGLNVAPKRIFYRIYTCKTCVCTVCVMPNSFIQISFISSTYSIMLKRPKTIKNNCTAIKSTTLSTLTMYHA